MAERLPLTLHAYRLLTAAATPLAPVLVSYRLKHGKELPERLTERYGESTVARPPGPLVWVHGASVGELLAVIPLIERICEKDFAVLCTSGTVTSANLAEQRLPKGAIHQFVILDTPRFVDRFFDHWKPDLAIFVESDLWPNLIVTSAGRGIPLILVNGRLSERSFNRWRRVPGTIAALLGCFDLCLAQSDAHAGRYRDLGASHIVTTGNLKLDVPEPPAQADGLAALKAAVGERTIIAGDSTPSVHQTTPTCNSTSTALDDAWRFTITQPTGIEAQTFGYDTVRLMQQGAPGLALVNVAANVLGCLLAAGIGLLLAR